MPAKSRKQQRALFAKLGPKKAKALGYGKISKKGGKHK
jgi:hypothetical protein